MGPGMRNTLYCRNPPKPHQTPTNLLQIVLLTKCTNYKKRRIPPRQNEHHPNIMAARSYSGGNRPSLVRSNTTLRYDPPGGRRSAKRARSSSRSSVRKQVLAMAETKHTHLSVIGGTGLVAENLMNAPAIGTGQHQRVGSKITVTGFFARITFRARNAQGIMRVVLYRPRDVNRTLSLDAMTPFGHIDKDEYVVYHDTLHPLSNSNGPDWDTVTIGQKFPSGLITTFDDSTTNIQDNPLRLWISGYNSLTPDEHNVDAMCYYKDM